jgi:hypothetical protein
MNILSCFFDKQPNLPISGKIRCPIAPTIIFLAHCAKKVAIPRAKPTNKTTIYKPTFNPAKIERHPTLYVIVIVMNLSNTKKHKQLRN